MKRYAAIAFIGALAACSPNQQPVVTQFNGDSVKILDNSGGSIATEATRTEANRICQTRGRRAEYVSTQAHDRNGWYLEFEHLYLCL